VYSGNILLVHFQEHQCTKEDHERVILLIEKQALVQVLIRESAHALATNKGRQVSYFLVSIKICIGKIACRMYVIPSRLLSGSVRMLSQYGRYVLLLELVLCFYT